MRFTIVLATGLVFLAAASAYGHAAEVKPRGLADAVDLAVDDACAPLLRKEATIESLAKSDRLPLGQSQARSPYSPLPTLSVQSADGGRVEIALNETSCTILFNGPGADHVQAELARRLIAPGSGWRPAYWESRESALFEQRRADTDPPGVTVILDDPERPGGRYVIPVLAPVSAQPSIAEMKAAAARPLASAVTDAVLDQCVALLAAVRAHPGPGEFTTDWPDAQRRRYWARSKWDKPNEMIIAAAPSTGEAKLTLVLDKLPAINCIVHAAGRDAAISYDAVLRAVSASDLWRPVQLPPAGPVQRTAFFSKGNSVALTLVAQGDAALFRIVQVNGPDEVPDLADWLPKAFTPAASRHSGDAIAAGVFDVCLGYVDNSAGWNADRARYYLREYGLTPYSPPVTESDPDNDVWFELDAAPLSCVVYSSAADASEGLGGVLRRLRADHRWQASPKFIERDWSNYVFRNSDGSTQVLVRQMTISSNIEVHVSRMSRTQ